MKKFVLIGLVSLLALGAVTTAFAAGAIKNAELDPKTGYYCTHPDAHQPALYALSVAYNTPYSQILGWFCDGRFGVGEIMLALQTSKAVNGAYTPEQILQMKVDMGGWGKVWQFLGLTGPWRKDDHPHGPNH